MIENRENRLLTEQEAAEFFGWSVYKMRQIRKMGGIQFVKFNRRTIRYTLSQLEDYKQQHMSNTAAQG